MGVSSVGGGALMLAGQVQDNFVATSLNNSLWDAGRWNGGSFTPSFDGASLILPANSGSWVRSDRVFTHASLETVATFGNGAWQHIGFGSDGFGGSRYLLFSTFTGDGNLHARVNNNVSEQRVNLGAIPTGMHRYRIDWLALNSSTDQVRFWLDGVQVAQMNVTNAEASDYYAYLSNNAGAALTIGEVDVAPSYVSSGNYTSCGLDAGANREWQTVNWSATAPTATGLGVQVRTSADGLSWGSWNVVSEASGSSIPAPGRFVQYQLNFSTTNAALSPQFDEIKLTFEPIATSSEAETEIREPLRLPWLGK